MKPPTSSRTPTPIVIPAAVRFFRWATLCLATALLTICPVHSAQPYVPILADPILEPWRWHPLPEVKGLGLLDILQRGPDDFWFASRDGLYHYNGRIKTRINLREGSVPRALALDTDRAVLVGSQFGISRIIGGVSEKVFPSADDPACDIRDLAVDGRGDLWAATNWGLLRFAGSTPNPVTPTLYTSRDQAESLRRSTPGSWAILKVVDTDLLSVNPWTDGVGLRTRSGIVGQVAEGGPSDLAGIEIGDRILEIDGRPGDLNARLSGKPGQPAKILVLRAANGDTVHRVIHHGKVDGTYQDLELYSVFRDKAGAIWMSTSSGDILRFTPSAGTWDRVTETDGPAPFGNEAEFLEAADGSVWSVNSDVAKGVARYAEGQWATFDLLEMGGTNLNTSIHQTRDGTIWIGGHKGTLHTFRDGIWRIYESYDTPLQRTRVRHLVETSDDYLIVANTKQAFRVDIGSNRVQTYSQLAYYGQTSDRTRWFLSVAGDAIAERDGVWTRFTTDDGLISHPTAMLITRDDGVWAVGGHNFEAATSRFDGATWSIQRHEGISWGLDPTSLAEAHDGTLWFGAAVGLDANRGHTGGLLSFDGAKWHRTTSVPSSFFYGIGTTLDDRVWVAGVEGLFSFDGTSWTTDPGLSGYTNTPFDVVYTSPSGDLWTVSRSFGLFHYDLKTWTRYDERDGLTEGRLRSVLEAQDGSTWAVSDEGVSRYDDRSWTPNVVPGSWLEGGAPAVKQDRTGAMWFTITLSDWYTRAETGSPLGDTPYVFHCIRYVPDQEAPDTHIHARFKEIAQPGNATLSWSGVDRWSTTLSEDLLFSWRLDNEPWSAYTSQTSRDLLALQSGSHTFEVRARDLDFQTDPTPAKLAFVVIPPVWGQTWFILLSLSAVLLTVWQAGRIVRSNRILRRQEEELLAARDAAETANRAKSLFLANMSHEIRTPMNAILGYAQILERDPNLDDNHRKAVDTIRESGAHLLSLINNVLDISKIEAGREELHTGDFDLSGLLSGLDAMFKLRCEQKGLTWELQEDLPNTPVNGDEGKIRQILINLLGNAHKFTDNGSVTLRVSRSTGNRHVFEVIDTGLGMTEELLNQLFEPFRQGAEGYHHGGTGLGLAISKRYVELMGGEINLESERGRGTHAYLVLDLKPGKEALDSQQDWSRVRSLSPGQHVRALVTDDDGTNRDILGQILSSVGVEVRTAESGHETLEQVRDWRPNILFLDIRMPGMDGTETLRRIIDEFGDDRPRTVAVTASVLEHETQTYREAGFDGLIDKPLRAEQVFAALAEGVGATFEIEDPEDGFDPLDFSTLSIPADLHRALRDAAEGYSVTDLRKHMDQLATINGSTARLAAHLREISGGYDMEQVIQTLDRIKTG